MPEQQVSDPPPAAPPSLWSQLPMTAFSLQSMTEQELEKFLSGLPAVVMIQDKVQRVLSLFREGQATAMDLQKTLSEVIRVEYARRKRELEKSLQHGVRSRHIALNNKYVELMDYLGCPWIQSVLPASLACQDIAYWVDQVRNSMPFMNMSGRLRELAGLPTEEDYEACKARGERIDGRPIVEPMDLKRRLMSMGEEDDETMPLPASHSTVSTAFRMVQMSIIMGFKVPFF